ncbi:MAG: amino-acid N-acetyltransferase [Gammaproteobacteria bacterium]|nr:amino-acid N-acetyltransferase [Gammaproteobacteria bacterium]
MDHHLQPDAAVFVRFMREASPYMRAHRGHTFVVYVAGELVAAAGFPQLVQDLTLLAGVGVRLVVVHGTRPQLAQRLKEAGLETTLKGHLRVTDAATLTHAKDAAAAVRYGMEAQFAHATRVRPLGASPLRIVSGNHVTARPAGIIDGVDLQFTGEIRRVDTAALQAQLEVVDVVLVSPLGYSPTGETFSLNAMDLATEVAIALKAAKLILLSPDGALLDGNRALIRQLTLREARERLKESTASRQELVSAARACQFGVGRVHLLEAADGALLLELFSRDGVGTLVSDTPFDQMRQATIEDVGGILDLIEPLEATGVLVKRSREKLETEIDHFMVVVRDGATVACAGLYPFPEDGMAEIAGVAVDPDYRRHGFGKWLMGALEAKARVLGLQAVFVLTTQAHHWFMELGYLPHALEVLPGERRALYNFQRNSQVLFKKLD